MSNPRAAKLAPFTLLEEPLLAFSPVQGREVDVHPLRGLIRYGPYSKSTFQAYTPSVRVLTVGPASGWDSRVSLMRSVQIAHSPSDRKEYLPAYPGFEKLFGAALVGVRRDLNITWPDMLQDLPGDGSPQERLVSLLSRTLAQLAALRNEFDVVLVHFPDTWGEVTKTRTFDAHDMLKAIAANHGIPTQVVNDRTFSFSLMASRAWRLSIALYVKAGGIPWKLSKLPGVPEDTAFIGLAYALRGEQHESHYVTCCSQVFDMDGGGMEFVAFEARDPVADLKEALRNPYLTRDDMRAVLARSLTSYQTRNGGRLPRRLVVHKTTAFKDEELDGAFDALSGIPEVECIEVNTSANWRGVWLVDSGQEKPPTKPSAYPLPRGTMLVRSSNSVLLWAAGNAPQVSSKGDYYQGGKSIPRPINLIRHAGRGSLEIPALEALAMTKMDWNNDALYDPLPVTILYSQRLARTIANVPDLPGKTYPYRLFM